MLIGRLTRDPETKSLPSGQSVANFGLATDRFFSDKAGQRQQQTEFHNIVLFGKLAEIATQYLNKGSLVLIEGRLQTRTWQDAAGNKKYRTEIVGERLQMGPKSNKTNFDQKPAENNPSEEIPIIEEGEDIDVKNIPF